MKNLIYTTLLLALSFGCNNANLNISTRDTKAEYIYEAAYPINKTHTLEKYFSDELNKDLPLSKPIDTNMNFANGEQFNVKARKGFLSIKFDKKRSSVTGYIQMKKLTDGISDVLK